MSADIGLDTHINDVLGVLEYEDLHDVILVGHSYAGMVIAGVAEKAAERDSYVEAHQVVTDLSTKQEPPQAIRNHSLPSRSRSREAGATSW